jgi:hypothetical protein
MKPMYLLAAALWFWKGEQVTGLIENETAQTFVQNGVGSGLLAYGLGAKNPTLWGAGMGAASVFLGKMNTASKPEVKLTDRKPTGDSP